MFFFTIFYDDRLIHALTDNGLWNDRTPQHINVFVSVCWFYQMIHMFFRFVFCIYIHPCVFVIESINVDLSVFVCVCVWHKCELFIILINKFGLQMPASLRKWNLINLFGLVWKRDWHILRFELTDDDVHRIWLIVVYFLVISLQPQVEIHCRA